MSSSRIDYGEYTVLMMVYVVIYAGIMFGIYTFFGEAVSFKETVAMAVTIVFSSVIFMVLVVSLYRGKMIKTNPNLIA